MRPFLGLLLVMAALGPSVQAFPPYYEISEHDQAQTEARARKLPLAWLGSFPECLTVGTPDPGSQADLTQMAMATLKDNAVIIFFDGRNMAPVPQLVHAQFHLQDDGPLPDGASWTTPKIVFSNPEVSKILGRVSATQMGSDRDVAINSALQMIRNDPTALAAPAAAPVSAPPPAGARASGAGGLSADEISTYGLYALGGLVVLIAVMALLRARSSPAD